MKDNANEFPSGGSKPLNRYTKFITLTILTLLFLLTTIPLFSTNTSLSLLHTLQNSLNHPIPKNNSSQPPNISTNNSKNINSEHKCNIFSGNWVPYDKGPYYTNRTNCAIDDRQNCIKFGRPDTDFMKWRWKPDECELPLFDAVKFLEIVRNKSLAFVGDSVGRNQMQSLVCLLASAAHPVDVSKSPDTRFRRWLYPSHNFTVIALWSPMLIKAHNPDPNVFSRNNLMNLYLDEVDEAWVPHVENIDIVIFSAGQWFFRPFIYYEKGKVVGCNICKDKNITRLTSYYAYRMAFRTALRTLLTIKNYNGLTFLRTFSPSHFENGDWNKGGNCVRTRPFTKEEMKFDGYNLVFYLAQMEEFRAAQSEAMKKGLKFRLIDTTEVMSLRPDGHPNQYGHWPHKNKTLADCVHWCMPGPIDTWNEFLLQMLKMEEGPIF